MITFFLSFIASSTESSKMLKLKLGVFFRHKSCFTFSSRKRLVDATFFCNIDYDHML